MSKPRITKAHAKKYAEFMAAIEHAKKNDVDSIVVAAPWVLGDDYEELTTNMNLVAEAQLSIYVGAMDLDDEEEKSGKSILIKRTAKTLGNKFFELRFSYYGSGDMEGEFSILCRAHDKEQAMALSKRHLGKVAEPPGKFLSDIPDLRVDLECIFEFDDVRRPVVIGLTEHEGNLSMSAAEPIKRTEDAGVMTHYWEGHPMEGRSVENPSSPPIQAVSLLFWEREEHEPEHPTFSNFSDSIKKGRSPHH